MQNLAYGTIGLCIPLKCHFRKLLRAKGYAGERGWECRIPGLKSDDFLPINPAVNLESRAGASVVF